MSSINIENMQAYLRRSISSINRNKVNGMLAEISFRNTLQGLGYADRISQGGWIMRNVGDGVFGHNTIVVFPQTINPNVEYSLEAGLADPPIGLHTICSTMHQIGVHSYYCAPSIGVNNEASSISWHTKQLGVPVIHPYTELLGTIPNFETRQRNYNFLRYNSNIELIPNPSVPEEFTKEHLRITLQTRFMTETSDIDGIFWGNQYTYPIEIKEKTVGHDNKTGDFFGIDVGPFVKLAFYAAKRGNLHSLFVVREINNVEERELVSWWFITFDTLAQYASWVPIAGGTNMQGGGSSVVKIPKREFTELNAESLAIL